MPRARSERARARRAIDEAPLWLRLVAGLIGGLSARGRERLSRSLAWLAFDCLRIRRAHVRASMRRIGFGETPIARGVYVELARSAVDFVAMVAAPTRSLAELATIDGWERFEAARDTDLGQRGVIVATGHTGNWDLVACACAARTPLAVLTKRLSSPRLDAFWQASRAERGVELVAAPDGEAIARCRALLAKGTSIALLVDQDPARTHSVVAAPFLGEVALHDPLAATLSARTGAPIVVAFARRDDDGAQRVEVIDVIVPPHRPGAAWIATTTATIASHLDTFVRRNPTSWLWLHRRWKTRPVG